MMEEISETCKLCGNMEETKSNYLRECYFFKNQGKFDSGLYVPRLTYSEKYKLVRGFNSICSNRNRCRKKIGTR